MAEGLSPELLVKLAKVLGMMGSAHDGEVLAAAKRAHLIVKNSGWCWPELLGVWNGRQPNRKDTEQPKTRRRKRAKAKDDDPLAMDRGRVEVCLAFESLWQDYELDFLKNIRARLKYQPLSEKQAAWLGRLYERAAAMAGAAHG